MLRLSSFYWVLLGFTEFFWGVLLKKTQDHYVIDVYSPSTESHFLFIYLFILFSFFFVSAGPFSTPSGVRRHPASVAKRRRGAVLFLYYFLSFFFCCYWILPPFFRSLKINSNSCHLPVRFLPSCYLVFFHFLKSLKVLL